MTIVGVPKETYPGEQRVALVPGVISSLLNAGLEVVIETGAGEAAGYRDEAYVAKGATIAFARAEVFATARVRN
jgi:NAD(P) transhydrogenase subunit alpha